MPQKIDVIIQNAQLRDNLAGELVDIGIQAGNVSYIGSNTDQEAEIRIDANGNQVTESFVNPHLHLDKVYTLDMLDELAILDYHVGNMGKPMIAVEFRCSKCVVNSRAW